MSTSLVSCADDSGPAIAVIGLACRFPDARDPVELLDLVSTGRRAFRRTPQSHPTGGMRAALVEHDLLDQAASGGADPGFSGSGPLHWLAAQTTARALAAAGFSSGAGLPRGRLAVFAAGPAVAAAVLDQLGVRTAAAANATPSGSSLASVASACRELVTGNLDLAIAGGADTLCEPARLESLDRLSAAGALAEGDLRIYDQRPTGLVPGEGAGLVLLMRAADAVAAGLPVYAEILGWHVTAPGQPADNGVPGLMTAMAHAYEMARVDPQDIRLFEGCGTGIGVIDEAELAALSALRPDARHPAALGAVSANIGHAGAAAGVASLIKTVMAISGGIVPPSTGIAAPHPMLADGPAGLRLPATARSWPGLTRLAGVSAAGVDDVAVHLVLRSETGHSPGRISRPARRRVPQSPAAIRRTPGRYPTGSGHRFAYLMEEPDRDTLIATVSRIAQRAPWLSDAELQDLAVQLSQEASRSGPAAPGLSPARLAIVAAGQEQLAALAGQAIDLLSAPTTEPGPPAAALRTRPGIFASAACGSDGADQAGGRIALALTGREDRADLPQSELSRILAVLHWLDQVGAQPEVAVGHGVGELAGLIWAECATPAHARELIMLRAAAVAAPAGVAPGRLSSVLDRVGELSFRPPQRRLLSGGSGDDITGTGSIADMLRADLLDARFAPVADAGAARARLASALQVATANADLLLLTGSDGPLARAAGALSSLTAVSIDDDPADDAQVAMAAAALFAAGALGRPEALYAGRPGRPVDIWREQIFLSAAASVSPQPGSVQSESAGADPAGPATTQPAAGAELAGPAGAEPGNEPATEPGSEPATEPGDPELSPAPAPAPAPVGAGPWARCYAEQTRPLSSPAPAGDGLPWRVRTGGCEPLRKKAGQLFPHDDQAGRTLAVIGGLGDPGAREAALFAAQDAISTGELVVISSRSALTGLWATLHAEHPELGITVIRAPLTDEGVAAASRVAAASAGTYRELVLTAGGEVTEPVMAPVALTGGPDFPIGPDDVVLISRNSGAAGLAFAQVLTCTGAAIVIIGSDHTDDDRGFINELERLRGAGARISYEAVDIADRGALVTAIQRVERRAGRITALSHATNSGPHRALADLSDAAVHEQWRRDTAVLDQLTTAVRDARGAAGGRTSGLRLIATFGSVTSRYGLAGEGMLALVTGALAEHAQRLAAASPGCRAVHVDWPAWSGTGLGQRADLAAVSERAGYAPIPVAQGARLLLKVLAAGGLPGRLAVHGRVGTAAPRPITAAVTDLPGAGGAGRFVERILVHYPGVELVAEATLTLQSDPYLADYQIDGAAVLPPGMALEAMAQVATALSGVPVRQAAGVTMTAPIILTAGPRGSAAVLRIGALREADAVTVVIRSDNSDFGLEHYRATFSCGAQVSQDTLRPQAGRSEPGRKRAAAAAAAGPEEADGAELYRSVCFQTGRFRRLSKVRLESSRSAEAVARGSDELPWFSQPAVRQGAEPALLLGSPGISDAVLQVVQACVPHRRLMPSRCESVSFSGLPGRGLVRIRATQTERLPSGAVPGPGGPAGTAPARATVPRQQQARTAADNPTESMWDVEVTNAAGQRLVTWTGLQMRHAGALPPAGLWPAPVLGCYLERVAAELGLDPSLRIRASQAAAGQAKGGAAGFCLEVQAAGPAACGWQLARPGDPPNLAGTDGPPPGKLAQAVIDGVGQALPGTAEAAATALTGAILACLPSDGEAADVTVSARQFAGVRWLLLRAGRASIAAVVADVAGLGSPVAIAIRTGQVAAAQLEVTRQGG